MDSNNAYDSTFSFFFRNTSTLHFTRNSVTMRIGRINDVYTRSLLDSIAIIYTVNIGHTGLLLMTTDPDNYT